MRQQALLLLDTNTVSYIADGRSPAARQALTDAIPHATIAVSALSEGELLYGLARKPQAVRLRAAVESLLSTFVILPWNSAAANAYATLRLRMVAQGRSLSAIDTLIAAQAIAEDATLVTRDAAFARIEALRPTVNWATDL